MENKNYKYVKFEINKNVETLGLIYYLADSSILYNNFAKSSHLLKYYINKFLKFKSHPTVIQAKKLIENGILEASTTPIFGLYYSDLPEFKSKYDIDYTNYNKKEKKEVENFLKQIPQFYFDAKLDSFFIKENEIYKKILLEINTTAPDSSYISTLEDYYGIQMLDYIIIPSIFIPNYFNFSQELKTKNGTLNYYVLGPAYDIETDSGIDYKLGLGFDNKAYVERIGIHEFGHTFVRFLDEKKYQSMIKSLSFLNTTELQKNIAKGYGNYWENLFEEHIVRLIEIRIAKKIGNDSLVNKLTDSHLNKNGFIYIKKMSEIILIYENNRVKYQKFEDFFPVLVEEMNKMEQNK